MEQLGRTKRIVHVTPFSAARRLSHRMLAFSLAFLGATAISLASGKQDSSPVGYTKAYAARVPMHIVQIDSESPNVNLAVVTPTRGIGTRESWAKLIGRARPVAAITGTYFDTASGIPIGSIGVAGHSVFSGSIGTAFMFTSTEGPTIDWAKPLRAFDFAKAQMFLRAGPRLLEHGKVALYPRDEGFRDPAVFQHKKRTALAVTRSGKLLLVAVTKPVLLREFAAALKGIGAVDAMCLDGGDSTGLYYRGKSIVAPNRALTNVLVAYESVDSYEGKVAELNPRTMARIHVPRR